MSLAARAAARLMAVVVLPTPPFWLAIAKTLLKRSGYHAVSRETKSLFHVKQLLFCCTGDFSTVFHVKQLELFHVKQTVIAASGSNNSPKRRLRPASPPEFAPPGPRWRASPAPVCP